MTSTWAMKSQNLGMSTRRFLARDRILLTAAMNWPGSSSCLVSWEEITSFENCIGVFDTHQSPQLHLHLLEDGLELLPLRVSGGGGHVCPVLVPIQALQ